MKSTSSSGDSAMGSSRGGRGALTVGAAPSRPSPGMEPAGRLRPVGEPPGPWPRPEARPERARGEEEGSFIYRASRGTNFRSVAPV